MQFKRRRLTFWLRVSVWAYLLCVLAAWFLLYAGGDRWMPATLLLFGPRWALSLPLPILVPLAAWLERRHLLVLCAAAVIVFGPVMGLCLPSLSPEPDGASIRVLTCNIGGGDFDAGKLRRLVEESAPDIVALQECDEKTAAAVCPGWSLVCKQGLAVASRYPVTPARSRQAMHPPHKYPRLSLLQAVVAAPRGELSVCSVHLPSPRYGLSNLLDRRVGLNLARRKMLDEERELRGETSREIEKLVRSGGLPVIVAGDFNMPVESAWYRQSWADYANAFSRAGFGYGQTMKADVRGFGFGIRIDHILTRGPLEAVECRVGPGVGSDHLPVLADFR